jgi:glycosyltransferase involved in cell wall biosynthesis
MRVLLDPQVFLLNYCGLLKYYSFLYQALKDEGIDIYSPVIHSSTPIFPERHVHFPGWFPSKGKKMTGVAIKELTKKVFYRAVSKQDYDVLFITSDQNETGFLNHIGNKPFVMTIHDTMVGVNGKNLFLDPNNQYTLQMGYLAHKAKKIISISNHTTSDIEKRFLIEPDKIQTIYHTNFLPDETETIEQLPDEYLLFVGNRNGRKNFLGWIQAVAPFLKTNSHLQVLVTGKLSEYELFFLQKMDIRNQVRDLERVSDSQLNYLYTHALCLVYPSLYEGFGLPVLEAMANGCPVITTRRSSIPEIAGDAALYIDPESDESMLHALKQLIQDDSLKQTLSNKGLLRSREFSKQTFVQQVIRVLREASL